MAKQNLGANGIIFPGAVLLIGTYDADGNPDVMNAACGGQCGPKHIALNLSLHKTTENLELKKAFTIAFGTKDMMLASDYVGPELVYRSRLSSTAGRRRCFRSDSHFVFHVFTSDFYMLIPTAAWLLSG